MHLQGLSTCAQAQSIFAMQHLVLQCAEVCMSHGPSVWSSITAWPVMSRCICSSCIAPPACPFKASVHCRFMRDMPYGQDILLENVVDPSHVPFSHHGVIGNRNKVLPSSMQTLEPVQSETGFAVGISVNKNGTNRSQQGSGKMTTLTFNPPTLAK